MHTCCVNIDCSFTCSTLSKGSFKTTMEFQTVLKTVRFGATNTLCRYAGGKRIYIVQRGVSLYLTRHVFPFYLTLLDRCLLILDVKKRCRSYLVFPPLNPILYFLRPRSTLTFSLSRSIFTGLSLTGRF